MTIKSVAKASLVIATITLSGLQLQTVLVKQALGEAPLTSPLTSPVIEPLTAPVQTPSNNNNSGNNNNNSGGSSNNGGNSGPRECNATKPTTAPILLRATQVAKNKVTLFWGKSNGPATGYVIVFGQKSGQELYATGTFGNAETNTFTVNDLTPGNMYYFRVKAINDCKPSDTSNELGIRLGTKYFMTSVISKQTNATHNGATYSLSSSAKFAPKKATKPVTIPFKKVEQSLLLSDLKTFFGKLFGN